MLLDVFSGAIILFVGVLTGYAICNVSHKRREAVQVGWVMDDEDPIVKGR